MSLSDSRTALLVAAAAFAIHLAAQALVLERLGIAEAPDYRGFYRPAAESLVAGRGLVTGDGAFAVRYPPGYPVALTLPVGLAALTGADADLLVRIWSLLLAAVTSALVYLGSRGCFAPLPSLAAAALWTLYPLALWMFAQNNSEVLFTPLLIGVAVAFAGALRARRPGPIGPLSVGALCGLAALVRPAAIGLAAVLAVCWLAWGRGPALRRLPGAALIAGAFLVVVTPWVVASHHRLGRLIPLSTGGPPSLADGLTYAVRDRGYREGVEVPTAARQVMLQVREGYSATMSTGEVLGLFLEAARARPLGAAQLLGHKAARSWYGTDSQRREPLVALIQLLFLPPVALGLWRAARWGDEPARALARTAGAVGGWLWLAAVFGLSIARYTVPAVAVAAMLLPGLALGRRTAVRQAPLGPG
jgi:hypothetical protein